MGTRAKSKARGLTVRRRPPMSYAALIRNINRIQALVDEIRRRVARLEEEVR